MNAYVRTDKTTNDFSNLSQQILRLSTQTMQEVAYMQKLLTLLLNFSGCDVMEYWIKREEKIARCSSDSGCNWFEYKIYLTKDFPLDTKFQELCWKVFQRQKWECNKELTKKGSLVINDIETFPDLSSNKDGRHHSLAAIPTKRNGDNVGVLILKSCHSNFFPLDEIEMYERFVGTLALAVINYQVQVAQTERVKELTCLYELTKLSIQAGLSSDEIFMRIVELLPPAWQYPEITSARIVLNDHAYALPDFAETPYRQRADIIIQGKKKGFIEVVYLEEKPVLDEGPFLKGERALINTMAMQVAQFIDKKQAQKEQEELQKQLRHTDRLATIGQLAAGVAHELNEPLGTILGYAQLAEKHPHLPEQAEQDINKIVSATLQARDVIKKLLLFARQTPHTMKEINVNDIVGDGLSFLEKRLHKAGITVERTVDPQLPAILGDSSLLQQVLVNLVVNALQAMPDGGNLHIMTQSYNGQVSLTVTDTGIGMDEEVLKQIFVPFFTTKDIHDGTGLGLAVVHGIVTSHKGLIAAESTKGKGTRFEITLPTLSSVEGNGFANGNQ